MRIVVGKNICDKNLENIKWAPFKIQKMKIMKKLTFPQTNTIIM